MIRLHDYEAQGLYSNPLHYYDFLQNRVMILFKPKFEESDPEHPEFHLTLSKKQNYDIVCSMLSIAVLDILNHWSSVDVGESR